jgi:hypothetical protein
LPLDPTKGSFEKRPFGNPKPFEKIFAKFLTVLFCPNGTVFLMGPLPHKFGSQLVLH